MVKKLILEPVKLALLGLTAIKTNLSVGRHQNMSKHQNTSKPAADKGQNSLWVQS